MRARDISHTRPADVKPGGGRFSLKILLGQNLLLQIDYSPHQASLLAVGCCAPVGLLCKLLITVCIINKLINKGKTNYENFNQR